MLWNVWKKAWKKQTQKSPVDSVLGPVDSGVLVCVGGSICDIYNSECASVFHVITNMPRNLAIKGKKVLLYTLLLGKVCFFPSIFLEM